MDNYDILKDVTVVCDDPEGHLQGMLSLYNDGDYDEEGVPQLYCMECLKVRN